MVAPAPPTPGRFQAPPLQRPERDRASRARPRPGRADGRRASALEADPTSRACRSLRPATTIERTRDIEGVVVAPDAYSRGEMLRHREFDRMTPGRAARRRAAGRPLVPRLEQRRTRRYELHSHGRRLAPRAMFRQNLGTGGQLLTWVWRRPVKEPRSLVVLCDISGSMERHSRLLLRFVQALSAARGPRRVVRLRDAADQGHTTAARQGPRPRARPGRRNGERLGRRDPDRRELPTFNQKWARRTLRSSGVVIVVSDGWDRGDPAIVAAETARLRRNCHRLVWLNPLAGTPGYQPLAGGMRAAYPYIDDFLPAGTVASLERLGDILGGIRSADTRRGARRPRTPRSPAPSTDDGAAPAAHRRSRWPRTPIQRREADLDEGAARDAATPGKGGRRRRPGGRRADVRSAPRPEGAVLLTPTTAGSPARSAAAASRAPPPRRSSRPARPARPRHPLRDQRRAGLGRRAGLRRHDRRAGEPGVPPRPRGAAESLEPAARRGGRHAAPRGLATGRSARTSRGTGPAEPTARGR